MRAPALSHAPTRSARTPALQTPQLSTPPPRPTPQDRTSQDRTSQDPAPPVPEPSGRAPLVPSPRPPVDTRPEVRDRPDQDPWPDQDPQPDRDLLDRLAAGDPAAWRNVTARYDRLVRSRVRAFRLQDADADDAVQSTWLRLAQNARTIHDPRRLPGWLSTVAGRECLRILDRSAHAGIPSDDAGAGVADPRPGPEQRALDSEAARLLRELVAGLPRRRQLLLGALFADEPWSYERISAATGIPTGSIGPTRARALGQLRALMTV